jgi:DNA-binding response OmpR family regulator
MRLRGLGVASTEVQKEVADRNGQGLRQIHQQTCRHLGLLDQGMQVMTKPFRMDALATRVRSMISD